MIYFTRHGQSITNAQGIFAGKHDVNVPLSLEGRRQAAQVGRDILRQDVGLRHIVSSPVLRAKDTAHIIAEIIGFNTATIKYDERLVGYDMGQLSGHPKANLTPRERISALGAEHPLAFQIRVMAGFQAAATLGGNVLVVSHAGVGRMLQAVRGGTDIYDFYTQGFPNAKLVAFDL